MNDVHSCASIGQGRKMVDWSGSIFWRLTEAQELWRFGTTVSRTYWLRAWCHGMTSLPWPKVKMSALPKTMYPHFRLKELHLMQSDSLILCMTSQLSTWDSVSGCHCDRSSFCFLLKLWNAECQMSLSPLILCLCVCICVCVWTHRSKQVSKSFEIFVSRRGSWDETYEDSEEHCWPKAEPGRDHVQSTGDSNQPQVGTQMALHIAEIIVLTQAWCSG